MTTILTERVRAEDCYELRLSTLRQGMPLEAAQFPQDADDDTVHLGRRVDSALIAVGTLVREAAPEGTGTWRVRGMATADEVRGQGHGSALLAELLSTVYTSDPSATVWCHAREAARTLYERAGFRCVGKPYTIGEHGRHIFMEKPVLS